MNSIPESSTAADAEPSLEQAVDCFNRAFPDDESCFQRLFELLVSKSLHCPNCGGLELQRRLGRKACCLDCRKTFSFTADTFFARTRKIRAWFLAIYLMEQGLVLSANHLHRLLDVALSSAWEMRRKVDWVLQSLLSDRSVPLSASEFAAAICKRSVLTPAGMHPVCENIASAEGACARLDQSEAGPMAGQINRIVNFVRTVFHGTSYKYLQLTLAACWCRSLRAGGDRTILQVCLDHEALTSALLRTYLSPSLVLVPEC